MLRLAHLLILFALFSCGTPEALKKDRPAPTSEPVRKEQTVPSPEAPKQERYDAGSVEGTVLRVEDGQVQVRRFKDNRVVVLRVRSTEGIYIGDRVQVTEGVVKKIASVRAKK